MPKKIAGEIQLPYMPLYTQDLLGSTRVQMLDDRQFAWYVKLLCHAWVMPGCRIPNDKRLIRRLLAIPKLTQKVDTVLGFFETDNDGFLYNKRQRETWQEQQEKHRKQREKSSKGGIALKKKRGATSSTTGTSTGSASGSANSELRTHKESTGVDSSRAHTRDIAVENSDSKGVRNPAEWGFDAVEHSDDIFGFGVDRLTQLACSLEPLRGDQQQLDNDYRNWRWRINRLVVMDRLQPFLELLVEIWQSRHPEFAESKGITRLDSDIRGLQAKVNELLLTTSES